MDRKKFLKSSMAGLSTFVALPVALIASSKTDTNVLLDGTEEAGQKGKAQSCELSPAETAGPFPIKSPAELARANIISDRQGVPLLISLNVVDQSENCKPLAGVFVDVWHCDAQGNYSQYGNQWMQKTDYRDKSFLRGRQSTDVNGQVSFISIFPGWYPGRAPHIHIEIRDKNENSLHVTQIAFPEDVCDTVYASEKYKIKSYTHNLDDNIFNNSIEGNMLDSITGNISDGYTLLKTIVV